MTIPINPMPVDPRSFPNITPFTVRDNATMLILVEQMRVYINSTLVPFINDNVGGLAEEWKRLSDELIERVETIADSLGSSVEDAQAARDAAEAAAALAEQFASTVQEIQDSAITAIFNDVSSEFRQAFNLIAESLIREDENDPGTFLISTTPVPPEPGQILPDPNDPGFFV